MTENTKLTKIKIFRRENVQEFLVSLSVCVHVLRMVAVL